MLRTANANSYFYACIKTCWNIVYLLKTLFTINLKRSTANKNIFILGLLKKIVLYLKFSKMIIA